MDKRSENDRPGRDPKAPAEEILLENVDLAQQDDQAAQPQVAGHSSGKKRLLPPSRIAFLAFVAIAAVVIVVEIRARWTYTRSVQAINQAWEAAARKGKPLYRADIQRLICGWPSSEYDRLKREEIFTWRGVRTHRLQVRYGKGEFVQTYQTVDVAGRSSGPF